ncbi:hypothetical protein [Peribacillus asahii]|uniref:hypothetical protein n=1 Tax=Peribacillus asahii TaxID=228899 RepID=UPI00380FE36E
MGIRYIEDINEEMNISIVVHMDLQSKSACIVDAHITPAFCLNCNQQVSGLFHYNGSRYGQVGEIECNHCHSTLFCTDDDYYQYRIFMSPQNYFNRFIYDENTFKNKLSEIDFANVYLLNIETLNKVQKKIGTNMLGKNILDTTHDIELNDLINLISKKLKITDIPTNPIIIDDRFTHLPIKVNKWLNLLQLLKII